MGLMSWALAGGVSGGANTYLDIREEERAEGRQKRKEDREQKIWEIRQRRLKEIGMEQAEYENELATERDYMKRMYDSEQAGLDRDEAARQAQLDRESRERIANIKTDSVTKPKDQPITLNNGQVTSYNEMFDMWSGQAFTIDDLGNKIPRPDFPGWEEWLNARVPAKFQINPGMMSRSKDAEPSTSNYETARKQYDDKARWYKSDESQFGMSEDEFVEKRARELMQEGTRQPEAQDEYINDMPPQMLSGLEEGKQYKLTKGPYAGTTIAIENGRARIISKNGR